MYLCITVEMCVCGGDCFLFLCLSLVMDPLSHLNVMHLQDPFPKPLDLTKALDVVKKLSQSDHSSGADDICSHRSEFGYESVCVPLNTLLPNGITNRPVKTLITTTGNSQTDNTGEERNSAGLQDAPLSRSHSRFLLPVVETLSSEYSGSGHKECFSCDDSSAIKVSPSVPTDSGAFLTWRVTENERRKDVSPILMESDVLQDSDSLESRNVLSTSEAENADFFKLAQNGSESSLPSPSSSSSSQKRAPSTKKNRNQRCRRSSAGKKATASTAKRRRKKCSGLSSMLPAFPSYESKIKLKYANRKEEKREGKGNTFTPYIRMDFTTCTVINFEEDSDVQARRKPTASLGIVPTTSCLQLGRLRSEVRHQTCELCCLCGQTANTAGLGDLHGPYRPCGPDRMTSTDVLINGGTKRKLTSDEVRECWVHEDCSIWSAGVFLIKGRLYGLDEVVRLAQKAVSLCSIAVFII